MESKTQFSCLIRNLSMLMTFLLIGLSDFTFITSVGAVDPKSYLQDTIEELKKKWPHNRSIRIVCHGHSVPAGYFKTPHVDTFNSYPHLLQVGLKEQFPHSVINVIVTAIGGENALQGAERFETEVLTHRPDILLIDYALNDRGIGLEKARDAWVSMIRKALSQETKVILLTPTGDHRADVNNVDDPLNQHADQIRKLAIEHKVALVDSLSLFKKYTDVGNPLSDLMSQVNHPNRRGHELVADALLDWFPTEE